MDKLEAFVNGDGIVAGDMRLRGEIDPEMEMILSKTAGSFEFNLSKLWKKGEERAVLRNTVQKEIEPSFRKLCLDLVREIEECMSNTTEAMREALGVHIGDGEEGGKTKFFKARLARQETKDRYAIFMSRFLSCIVVWSKNEDSVCERSKIRFSGAQQRVMKCFAERANSTWDIVKLMEDLMVNSPRETYSGCPVACFVVGNLLNEESNLFSKSEQGNQAINALKYFFRGCSGLYSVILGDERENEEERSSYLEERLDVLSARFSTKTCSKSFRSFPNLMRMHKVVGSFERPIKNAVEVEGNGKLKWNSISMGFDVIGKVAKKLGRKMEGMLEKFLLRGLGDEKISEAFPGIFGVECPGSVGDWASTMSGYGLRTSSNNSNAWKLLASHIFNQKNVFFHSTTRALNVGKTRQYLGWCLKFEKLALPFLHLVSGLGSRASGEFESLTFRNSCFGPRSVMIYDNKWVLVHGTSFKTSLLTGTLRTKQCLASLKAMRPLLVYWAVVRPWAHFLRVQLEERNDNKLPASNLWYSHCFVKAKEYDVRSSVVKCLPNGIRFNDLRHVGKALFRSYILPEYAMIERDYDIDQHFGHHALTGDQYGRDAFSSGSTEMDVSKMIRVFSRYSALLEAEMESCSGDDEEEDDDDVSSSSSSDGSGDDDGDDEDDEDDDKSPSSSGGIDTATFLKCIKIFTEGEEYESSLEDNDCSSSQQSFLMNGEEEKKESDDEDLVFESLGRQMDMLEKEEKDKKEMQEAVKKVIKQTSENAIVVLPTGAGKTVSVISALEEADDGLSIVVIPYQALVSEMVEKLRKVFDECKIGVYGSGSEDFRWTKNLRVMVVSAEKGHDLKFLSKLSENKEMVKRVIFDEASSFLNSSFRKHLDLCPLAIRGSVNCRFYLLSATIGKEEMDKIGEAFGICRARVVRASTARENVSLSVSEENVVNMIGEMKNKRAIIFVMQVKDCEKIRKRLDKENVKCGMYHSELSVEEKRKVMKEWKEAKFNIMVATDSLIRGINVEDVNVCVFYGGAYSLDSIQQGLGRLARGPMQEGKAYILAKSYHKSELCDEQVREFLNCRNECRRVQLSERFDEGDQVFRGKCGKCDTCVRFGWKESFNKSLSLVVSEAVFFKIDKTEMEVAKDEYNLARRCHGGLADMLKSAKGRCFLCSCFGKRLPSRFQCRGLISHFHGECLKCGERGHMSTVCPNKLTMCKTLSTRGHCVTCSLPTGDFWGNKFHVGKDSMGKHCVEKDTVLSAAICLSTKSHLKALKERLVGSERFFDWAVKVRFGVSNAARFVWLSKKEENKLLI